MNQSESQEQSDVTLDRDKRAESSTKALDFNEPEGSDLEDQESGDFPSYIVKFIYFLSGCWSRSQGAEPFWRSRS